MQNVAQNIPQRSSEFWLNLVSSQPKLKDLLIPRYTEYIAHAPTPKQQAFLLLDCLDAFYEVDLPDIFRFIHPVGTVLGRGKYSDYFLAYQRVTVGGNMQLEYPVLGKGVIMYGGSAVIGKCNIGDGCLLAFGTVVKDQDIPSNTTVAGKDSGISCEKPRKNPVELYFNI